MKTPTIDNYLEAFLNPAGRFNSLTTIAIQRDTQGQPLYAVPADSIDFVVELAGKTAVACCPRGDRNPFEMREGIKRHYGGVPTLLLSEVLVFDDGGENRWCDLWLVEEVDTSLFHGKPAPDDAPERETAPMLHFAEGLAAVERNEKYGYVNRNGKTVIPFLYDWADSFDEGLAVIKQGEFFGLIDKKGREILPPVYEDIRWRSANGVVPVCCENGAWKLHDRTGAVISENTFDFIFDFSNDLASVRRGDKYGYIDRGGEVVIPLLYDEAYSFSDEGLATVVKNGITFMIDTEGMVFD